MAATSRLQLLLVVGSKISIYKKENNMALQAAHHNVGYHESCEPEPAGEALHENESVVVRTLVASRVVHHMSVPRSRVWECRCPWIIHGYPCPESLK